MSSFANGGVPFPLLFRGKAWERYGRCSSIKPTRPQENQKEGEEQDEAAGWAGGTQAELLGL